MSNSDCWCSPPEITIPLAELFGGPVDVDPCSNERSIVQATLAMTTGGLVRPWVLPASGRSRTPIAPSTVYQNDPYSQAQAWTTKAISEMKRGHVRELVRLSMMSTSAQWWADMCLLTERNPRILALKRLKFLDPYAPRAQMKRQSCRFEPALTYFGPRVKEFERAFGHLVRWSTWGR